MNDREIVELLWNRDTQGLAEAQNAHSGFCLSIAQRLVPLEDAQECVNDALRRAWEHIPPDAPENLRLWLARTVRNLALDRYRAAHSQKRCANMTAQLDELTECLGGASLEETVDSRELGRAISRWLAGLDRAERILFMGRYWYGVSVKELASQKHAKPEQITQKMYRLRRSLQSYLQQEGYVI